MSYVPQKFSSDNIEMKLRDIYLGYLSTTIKKNFMNQHLPAYCLKKKITQILQKYFVKLENIQYLYNSVHSQG